MQRKNKSNVILPDIQDFYILTKRSTDLTGNSSQTVCF